MALTCKNAKYLIPLMIAGFFLLRPLPVDAQEWGKILAAATRTNIRADRSIHATVTGQLNAGERVRCDFLKDGWYAIFNLDEKERYELKARGYVYAPLLVDPSKSAAEQGQDKSAESASQEQTAPPTAPQDDAVQVKNIKVKFEPLDHEMVYIDLSHDMMPQIFPIEGKDPRVVIDFSNALPLPQKLTRIKVEGKLIRQIRSAFDRQARRLRIVVDLTPAVRYEVAPLFYKAEQLYVVDISEKSEDMKK